MDLSDSHDEAPPHGRLIVHWSNSNLPPPLVQYTVREDADWIAIGIAALCIWIGLQLVTVGASGTAVLIVCTVAISVAMGFRYARGQFRRVVATPTEERLLEDDGIVEKAVVQATFRPLGAPEGRDRGVLTLIDGSLSFIGTKASCSVSLAHRGATKCDHATSGRQGSIYIKMPSGDEVVFEFLNSTSDPLKTSEEALMRAVRAQTLVYAERRRQAELPNCNPDD